MCMVSMNNSFNDGSFGVQKLEPSRTSLGLNKFFVLFNIQKVDISAAVAKVTVFILPNTV